MNPTNSELESATELLNAARPHLTPERHQLDRIERRVRQHLAKPMPQRGLGRWLAGLRLPRRALAGGLAVVLIGLGALLLGPHGTAPVSAAEILQRAQTYASRTVEPGQVRHIVHTSSFETEFGLQEYTSEIWLAQGQEHLLVAQPLWEFTKRTLRSESLPGMIVNDAGTWIIRSDGSAVEHSPFDECVLSLNEWVGDPNLLADLQAQGQAEVLGEEVLDGRPVAVVDIRIAHLWIDLNTGQILQFEGSPEFGGGSYRVLVDETLDASAAPANLFAPPLDEGLELIEQAEPQCFFG